MPTEPLGVEPMDACAEQETVCASAGIEALAAERSPPKRSSPKRFRSHSPLAAAASPHPPDPSAEWQTAADVKDEAGDEAGPAVPSKPPTKPPSKPARAEINAGAARDPRSSWPTHIGEGLDEEGEEGEEGGCEEQEESDTMQDDTMQDDTMEEVVEGVVEACVTECASDAEGAMMEVEVEPMHPLLPTQVQVCMFLLCISPASAASPLHLPCISCAARGHRRALTRAGGPVHGPSPAHRHRRAHSHRLPSLAAHALRPVGSLYDSLRLSVGPDYPADAHRAASAGDAHRGGPDRTRGARGAALRTAAQRG